MQTVDCQQLLTNYSDWLRLGLKGVDVANGCRITTPFVDRHHDFLEVYISALPSGQLRLSDDGYVIRDLEISGFELEGERRHDALATILRSFDIRLAEDELVAETTIDAFPRRKHDFIQAMLAIGEPCRLSGI
jgi:hypothetical protein